MATRNDRWFEDAHRLSRSGPGAAIGHENRERVREYFLTHIGCSNVECGKALGLSVYAVGRHVEKLREEWVGCRALEESGRG